MNQKQLSNLNCMINEAIENFRKDYNGENFFRIVDLLDYCRSKGLTKEEVPQMILMQNIVVMG